MNLLRFKLLLKNFLPSSYQLKVSLTTILIRTTYIGIVFTTYYFVLKHIPRNMAYHLELALVLVAATSIVVFLPLMERFAKS